mmetsp:Transcript_6341/g.12013  ORF Transcript_6341/g.12013 Transcript_6341/m.12013 type:complete len:243 (+) Transcript_6341:485-1213(+)
MYHCVCVCVAAGLLQVNENNFASVNLLLVRSEHPRGGRFDLEFRANRHRHGCAFRLGIGNDFPAQLLTKMDDHVKQIPSTLFARIARFMILGGFFFNWRGPCVLRETILAFFGEDVPVNLTELVERESSLDVDEIDVVHGFLAFLFMIFDQYVHTNHMHRPCAAARRSSARSPSTQNQHARERPSSDTAGQGPHPLNGNLRGRPDAPRSKDHLFHEMWLHHRQHSCLRRGATQPASPALCLA